MGLLLDIGKNWFLQFPGKLVSFKRQFLREAVVDSNTNLMHSLPAYDMAMAMPQGPHHSIHHVNAEVLWEGVSERVSERASAKSPPSASRLSIRPCFVQLRIKLILHSSVCPTRLSVYSVSHTHFPGNCKNHFFPMFKSSPIVCTIYGHVSYAAILYTKPEGPYFHHVKSHRDWSSHSRVEICA